MTKYDKLLIAFVIMISLSVIFLSRSYLNSSASKKVYIEVDGNEYREILIDDNLKMDLDIKTEYGYNKVRIESGRVRVIEADCPDQIDVKQGPISQVGEIIVCLPHRLTVEIRGSSDDREVDYISN